ncbi:hypothetical protein F4859DRAFT_467397 [Xylaria cf. heliscus]|nr:hypothetical protein F4859DRAFT_467397 [Xylaria cf. heliscus]
MSVCPGLLGKACCPWRLVLASLESTMFPIPVLAGSGVKINDKVPDRRWRMDTHSRTKAKLQMPIVRDHGILFIPLV